MGKEYIGDRIWNAICKFRKDHAKLTPSADDVSKATPNVIYLGNEDFYDMASSPEMLAHIEMHRHGYYPEKVYGLHIVRVMQLTYLHVSRNENFIRQD